MERETVISGYCRQLDGSRMVCVEAEGNRLTDVDCQFSDCPYAPACPIAEKIQAFIAKADGQ